MDNGINLSEVINLIMSNPELMNTIKSMGQRLSTERDSEPVDSKAEEEREKAPETASSEESTATYSHLEQKAQPGGRRRRLLSALKPYLSADRASALDSILVIGDVLDAMKGG